MGVVDSLVSNLFSCFLKCPLTCLSVLFIVLILNWLRKLLQPKGKNPFDVSSVRAKEKLETDVKKRDAVLKQVSIRLPQVFAFNFKIDILNNFRNIKIQYASCTDWLKLQGNARLDPVCRSWQLLRRSLVRKPIFFKCRCTKITKKHILQWTKIYLIWTKMPKCF